LDEKLSDDDWKIVGNLVQLLNIFMSATEVLTGEYLTVSLVLLFTAWCYAERSYATV